MTKEDIQIRREKFMTYQQIADEFGVSRQRVHQIYRDYRSFPKGRLRSKVYALHGGVCVMCGTRENLEIHHMDANRRNNDLTNLTLLCIKHHKECEKDERENLGLHKRLNNANKLPDVKKICPTCSKDFYLRPYKYQKDYCSAECRPRAVLKRTTFTCLSCGKPRTIKTHLFKRQGAIYCSRECFGLSIRLSPVEREVRRKAQVKKSIQKAKERYANDPEYRERRKERYRRYYRKKAEKQRESSVAKQT